MKCPKCGSEDIKKRIFDNIYGVCLSCGEVVTRLDKVLSKFKKTEDDVPQFYLSNDKQLRIEYDAGDFYIAFRSCEDYCETEMSLSLNTVESLLKDLSDTK